MSNLSDHTKNYGGLNPQITSTSPPTSVIYKDVNGQIRVNNSGVMIVGQPEAASGITFTTQNDRGKA